MSNVIPLYDTVGPHRVHVFMSSNPASWELWPKLEERLRLYSVEIAPDTPVELLIVLLREAFARNSPGHFMLLVLRGSEAVGHLIGWMETSWNKHHVLIHQAKLDEPSEIQSIVWGELYNWIGVLNALGVEPPIEHLRFVTTRGDGWYKRLKGLCNFDRSVLSVGLENIRELAEGDTYGRRQQQQTDQYIQRKHTS